jgi:hypothetical protein
MSVDERNSKSKAKQDTTWGDLIKEAQSQIEKHQSKILALRKSIKYFKKEESSGVPFPELPNISRELS